MAWFVAALLVTAQTPLPLVAIDPGHGGEADGAIGICGAKEKEVALRISIELRDLLNASGHARAMLTRTADQSVELEERAALANRARADLFLSIHANSSPASRFHGIETYFLSRKASDRRSREVAARENGERPGQEESESTALQELLLGLRLHASAGEGLRLADRLQERMSNHLEQPGRGVLQAPFIVLRDAEMPAALVETGFLSNQEDCERLADGAYQRKIARALAAALLEHLALEKRQVTVAASHPASVTPLPANAPR